MGRMFALFCFLLCIPAFVSPVRAAQNESPLTELKKDTLAYFTPLTGSITSVKGNSVTIEAANRNELRPGMRLHAFKEGVDFVHPVTKEPLGRIELPVGSVEVTSSGPEGATGVVVKGRPEDFSNAKVKLPGTKIKVLFYQGNVDWIVGDSYYQLLKESDRFELIDTAIENADTSKIAAEAKAKGAEVLLMLGSENMRDRISLEQRLIWVSDGKEFASKKVMIDSAGIKELRSKSGMFEVEGAELLLSFHLSSSADRIAVADIDGDGSPELLLISGDTIKAYRTGVDLKIMAEFKLQADDILWVDSIEADKNGKVNILCTAIKGDAVTSYIYEFRNDKFVELWRGNDLFLRRLSGGMVTQRYVKGIGYQGDVSTLMRSDAGYKKGESLKLPPEVNIYDFQYISSPDGKKAVLAWDETGYLNLYNEKGILIWRSRTDYGGFSTTFKKDSPTVMVDRGVWSVKDRLVTRNGEVLAPKRTPLAGMARGLGYSSSEIRSIWWNGVTVEERTFVNNSGGNLLDYGLTDDRLIMLTKMPLLTKALNIFKGRSPFGVMLYFFSMKGK